MFPTFGYPWNLAGLIETVARRLGLLLRRRVKGLAHSGVGWFIARSEPASCTAMLFLTAACDMMLGSRALNPRVVSDLSVSVPLTSASQQLINSIGFLKFVDSSSFDPVVCYVAYYQSDEVDCSVVDIREAFVLPDFAAGRGHLLQQEGGTPSQARSQILHIERAPRLYTCSIPQGAFSDACRGGEACSLLSRQVKFR